MLYFDISMKHFFVELIQLPFILLFFPLYLAGRVFPILRFVKRSWEQGLRTARKTLSVSRTILRFLGLVGVFGIVLPVWFVLYIVAGTQIGMQLRLIEEPIPVAGTGSMYPTFPKGVGKTPQEQASELVGLPGMLPYPNGLVLLGKRYFNHEIGRGDIVVFENKKTREITKEVYGEESGMVKRVVALAGDTVEIKDGIVYLNTKPLQEPYIARARSTFGGEFLSDCERLTVPEGKLFVMGDNRKGSGDSRHDIGFIAYGDIDHVLPLERQKGTFDQHWRDTSKDFSEEAKIVLNSETFLSLLNEKRKEKGVTPLRFEPKLADSARRRAEVILSSNDFSFEATRSGYTMEKAIAEAGYSNIIWGEAPSQGYYEAEELIEHLFEFPDSQTFLTDTDYDDVGIAEVEGLINGCPTKVIVQHFAGYVPPDYNAEDVQGWEKLLGNLQSIQAGWQELSTHEEFYQAHKGDVDRINEIIRTRINNISGIVSKMKANQWLTDEQIAYTKQDEALFKEQEAVASRLNSR